MLSSADPVDAALERAVMQVQQAVSALAPEIVPIVVIDGRSGAGKSTVADRLRKRWPGAVNVIGLDELYPGWDGLAAGADMVRTRILEPIAAGRDARWKRWDWANGCPAEQEVVTPASLPLIVEGAGVLTAASAPLAHVRLWLESPEPARRDRALARDGETYRPHWSRWAAQEEAHLRTHSPRAHATICVDVP